jgi:hypothetical protein
LGRFRWIFDAVFGDGGGRNDLLMCSVFPHSQGLHRHHDYGPIFLGVRAVSGQQRLFLAETGRKWPENFDAFGASGQPS